MTGRYAKTVGFELIHAARQHRARAAQLFGRIGVYPGQEQVLTALAGGPCSMGKLAAAIRVRPPTVTKAIVRLSVQGLVERVATTEKDDGRTIIVTLTAEGRDRLARIGEVWAVLEAEAVAGFRDKDLERIRKLLRQVAANMAVDGDPALADDQDAA